MWDCVLSILVIFHLVSEYAHYAFEYVWGIHDGARLRRIEDKLDRLLERGDDDAKD